MPLETTSKWCPPDRQPKKYDNKSDKGEVILLFHYEHDSPRSHHEKAVLAVNLREGCSTASERTQLRRSGSGYEKKDFDWQSVQHPNSTETYGLKAGFQEKGVHVE